MKLIDVNQHIEIEQARKNDYSSCSLSVLDNLSDPNITFDKDGICNYYYDYINILKNLIKHIQIRKGLYLKKLMR